MTLTAVRDRRTLWKSAVVAAAVVMLIGVLLPGSAKADVPGDSSRAELADLIDSLNPAEPGDSKAVHHFDKAANRLLKAESDDDLWDGNGEPGKKGTKIFEHGADAAKELVKAGMPDDADLLAGYFSGLADAAMAAGNSDKSKKHYAKAGEELAKGKPAKAIDSYAKAWKYALKASNSPLGTTFVDDVDGWLPIDSDELANQGFPGSGSVYTFQFIHRTTGQLLVVSGWSESNEGFLSSAAFESGDTYTGTAGQMQVHVSCSDAFAGGVGQKSDPAPGSQWLVDYARIVKYRDGVASKQCLLAGFGSGLQQPVGGLVLG